MYVAAGVCALSLAPPLTGKIKQSLILHPDDSHIIYPLGSTIVIKNVENTEKQVFLQGMLPLPCCLEAPRCLAAAPSAALRCS